MRLRMRCSSARSLLAAVVVIMSSLALAQGAGHPDKGQIPTSPPFTITYSPWTRSRSMPRCPRNWKRRPSPIPPWAAEMKKIEDADVYHVRQGSHDRKIAARGGSADQQWHYRAQLRAHTDDGISAAIGIAAEDRKKQPPAYINPVNIKFVRDHKAELEKLNLFEPALDKKFAGQKKRRQAGRPVRHVLIGLRADRVPPVAGLEVVTALD